MQWSSRPWVCSSGAKHGTIAVITKVEPHESNTNYAQGGVSAVLCPSDSVESHMLDAIVAGAYLCDEETVRVLLHMEFGYPLHLGPQLHVLHPMEQKVGRPLHLDASPEDEIGSQFHALDVDPSHKEEEVLSQKSRRLRN